MPKQNVQIVEHTDDCAMIKYEHFIFDVFINDHGYLSFTVYEKGKNPIILPGEDEDSGYVDIFIDNDLNIIYG